MSAKEKYQELKNKVDQARKEMESVAKEAFKEGAKALFNENPTLNSFAWTQYTDFFNDGDTCNFHAHTDYPEVNGERETYSVEEEFEKLATQVSEFLNTLDNDDFKTLFGDHVRVEVTREDVSVSKYTNHD